MLPEQIAPTQEELQIWDEYKRKFNPDNIAIPYTLTIGAVTIGGIFYLKEPVEDSYTDGYILGFVNGEYHLDKNGSEAVFKGPNPQYPQFKAYVKIAWEESRMVGRVCNVRFNGSWNCNGWQELATW